MSGSSKRYGTSFLTRVTQAASLSFPGGESELVDSGVYDAHYMFHRVKDQGNAHRVGPKAF